MVDGGLMGGRGVLYRVFFLDFDDFLLCALYGVQTHSFAFFALLWSGLLLLVIFLRHLLHLIFFCLGWICSFGSGLACLSSFLSLGKDGLDGRLPTESFFAWAGGLLFSLSCIDVHGGVG